MERQAVVEQIIEYTQGQLDDLESLIEEKENLQTKLNNDNKNLNESITQYEKQVEERDSERINTRRLQVGSGARSEKIRTYNYPQSRVTDHRINVTIYQLENFLNGNIDEMIESLIAADRADRLKEGNL